jgi:hypothetical protein
MGENPSIATTPKSVIDRLLTILIFLEHPQIVGGW